MWPFQTSKRPPTLSEDFIARFWDLKGQVEEMDQRLDSALDDLKRRAASVRQAEVRLDAKRDNGPQIEVGDTHIDKVRRLQRGTA